MSFFKLSNVSSWQKTVSTPLAPKPYNSKDPKLIELLDEFRAALRKELPPGLPSKQAVDHVIESDSSEKLPCRPLFYLSRAELMNTKE